MIVMVASSNDIDQRSALSAETTTGQRGSERCESRVLLRFTRSRSGQSKGQRALGDGKAKDILCFVPLRPSLRFQLFEAPRVADYSGDCASTVI